MDFHDKTIHSADCGTNFSFDAGEDEFFQSRGYANEPRRCPPCRKAGKTERHGNRGNSYWLPRQTFPVRHGGCGKDTEVPFALVDDRLAYYSNYLSRIRLTG
jgi:hypothetical protein